MAELEAKFGGEIRASLVEGDRGAFEVSVDGDLIYSKLQTHRFPRYAEIPALIRDRM